MDKGEENMIGMEGLEARYMEDIYHKVDHSRERERKKKKIYGERVICK